MHARSKGSEEEFKPPKPSLDDSFEEKMVYVEGLDRAEKLKKKTGDDNGESAIVEKRRLFDLLQSHAEKYVWERRQKQRWKLINNI